MVAMAFCIAIHPEVQALDARLREKGGFAICDMDDVYVVGPPDVVFSAVANFAEEVRAIGLELVPRKSICYSPALRQQLDVLLLASPTGLLAATRAAKRSPACRRDGRLSPTGRLCSGSRSQRQRPGSATSWAPAQPPQQPSATVGGKCKPWSEWQPRAPSQYLALPSPACAPYVGQLLGNGRRRQPLP